MSDVKIAVKIDKPKDPATPAFDGLAIGGHITPFSHIAAIALDEWFTAHIHGTALSRNTRAYNEAHAAYQRLRGFLSHLDD